MQTSAEEREQIRVKENFDLFSGGQIEVEPATMFVVPEYLVNCFPHQLILCRSDCSHFWLSEKIVEFREGPKIGADDGVQFNWDDR